MPLFALQTAAVEVRLLAHGGGGGGAVNLVSFLLYQILNYLLLCVTKTKLNSFSSLKASALPLLNSHCRILVWTSIEDDTLFRSKLLLMC
jgi:hypothetical protein